MIGFVHIPKTAGTTMKFILRNSTFLKHCDIKAKNPDGVLVDEDLEFAKKVFFFGLRSIGGHNLYYPTGNLSEPIHYFTFIREPLQRCLSQYQHVKRGLNRAGQNISFEEFIQDEEMRNVQVRWISGGQDLEKAKHELENKYMFVGLTEYFAESLAVLEALSPYKINLRYERRHVAKENTAKQEVLDNPRLCRLLEEGNTLDMGLYEFVKDVIYPTQLKKAGLENAQIDEKDHKPDPLHFRYRLTRGYNQAVYRSLMKRRKRPSK